MGLGTVAAVTGLMLNPFASAPDLLQVGKPWFGFEDQGPVLQLVRVQKVSLKDSVKSCKAWIEALSSVSGDEWVPVRATDNAEALRQDWSPWTEKDLEPIQDCDDFPCKVKLDSAEVEAMKKASKTERVSKFHSLVLERLGRYLKTQARKAYEFPGDPIDPWKLFEARGFRSATVRPATPTLFARKLNFAPDKMLTMHQVLDRRFAKSPSNTEAVAWVRDVYTDHYFDSWGEWTSVHCESGRGQSSTGEVVVIQSLLSEMDLLKSKNFFARAAFGRYRSAFEDNGKIYLEGQFDRLKKLAEKPEATERSASAEKLAPGLSPGR